MGSKDETRSIARPERARRDTFELLGVAEDEGAYASLITWLLDPEGEHGLGSALLDQLAHFLEVLGVDWSPGEEFDGKVRVNEDNCGIVLKGAQGKGIVIVLRLGTGGGEVRGLDGVRAAGVPVMGLAYGPSAFPASSEMPVWRLQAVAQALRSIPEGPFASLLREFRRRLGGGRGATGGNLSALENFIRAQLDDDTERTKIEGVGDEMLFNEDLSRAYVLGGLLGEGGQGSVYTVGIQGGQFFDGFANPVSKAVMKLARLSFGLVASFTDLITLPQRKKLAKDAFAALKAEVGAKVLALAADTERAFVRYQAAMQIQRLREVTARAAQLSAELADRFHAAGNISPRQLAQARSAASQAKVVALSSAADAFAARRGLATILGVSTGDAWQVIEQLPLPPSNDERVETLLAVANASRLDLEAAKQRAVLTAKRKNFTAWARWLGAI